MSFDRAPLERNLRLLPWWWVLRWTWFGEAIWVIYLTRERGLTLGEVFLFEAAFSAAQIAAEVPTGMLADRYGRRLSLVVGTTVGVAAFFAFGAGASLWLLLGAYALLGIAEAFQSGANSALLFDTLGPLGRQAEFAPFMGRFNAQQTAGIAFFTVAGAAMVHWVPLWVPIVLSGVASVPAIAVAWRTTEPPRRAERPGFGATGREALRAVRRSRAMWSAILLLALGQVGIVTMGVSMQPVVAGYGVPLWTLGLFVAAPLALSTVGSLLAAPMKRWLGLPATFLLMPLLGALALLAGASGVPWLYPLFILPSITFNVLYVHVIDFITRRAPDELRATTISIGAVMASLANIASTVAVGALVDGIGLGGALAAAGIVFAALSAGAFALWLGAGDVATEPAPSATAA